MWTPEGNIQVLVPVRELAAWIESNSLLELTKAPFSKSDETLQAEAGSCANCPRRKGFNNLLLSDIGKQSDCCTDPQCFRANRENWRFNDLSTLWNTACTSKLAVFDARLNIRVRRYNEPA